LKAAHGQPETYELAITVKNGDRKYLNVTNISIVVDNKIVGVYSIAEDITDRKKIQAALQESMERFQRIADNAPDIIFRARIDPSRQFEYVSPASTKIIGYTPEEHYADPDLIIRMVHPDDRIFIDNMISAIVKHTEVPGVYGNPLTLRWIHKDGHIVHIEQVIVPIYNEENRAVAIEGIARDVTDRKTAEADLSKALETVTSTLEGTMEAVAMMSELRDPYTAGHQKMVTHLALAIGREIGLPEDSLRGLRAAGLLHDVGKVYVPSEILSKPGKLSALEMGLAKAHAGAGYDIVKAIKFPWPVDEMIHQHHERINGSGYPRGLKGDQIMLEARILAVADTVEAMMSHRPYRAALGLDKALEEISQNRGTLYDEKIVDVCVQLFREKDFTFPQ
jgi:PAS domain S-box-containing protein/putative nucleotidyltransferase with HDIG domain